MSVLIIQENGRHERNRLFRECHGFRRGLSKLGVSSTVWGLGHENYEQLPDFESYEVIVNLENYDETGWLPDLRNVNTKKFLWVIDAHVRTMTPYLITATEGNYDLILQATPDFVHDSSSVWIPNCFDDEMIKPSNVLPMYDWGFCGNINNRGHLLDAMKSVSNSYAVEIMALGQDMVDAICSYRLHWNANIRMDINYRNFETMGCRVPLITSFNANYEKLGMKHGENCLIYNNVPTMVQMAKDFLKKPKGDREALAEAGYQLSKQHTFKERAKQIMRLAGVSI